MSHSAIEVSELPEPYDRGWPMKASQVRPKVVVKADLMPAVSILFMISLVGIPLGWLWSRLAPAQQLQIVSANGQMVPLPLESWHRFDALAIFFLLSLGIGVLLGAGGWLLRQRRGPVVMVGIAVGSMLAGWLATMMGASFAQGRYSPSGAPALGDVIAQAPEIGPWWIVLTQPLAVFAVYGALALWNGRDDLGRRLG